MTIGRCITCWKTISDDEYMDTSEGPHHIRCKPVRTMKHILSFDDESMNDGGVVFGCTTELFLTRKLDRLFIVESLVVLTPDFFIVSIELEGQPTAQFGRSFVGEAAGVPLPMPTFVIEPGKQLRVTVVNAKESKEFFGAYFFGTLEIDL
jgi:hypothetical protein